MSSAFVSRLLDGRMILTAVFFISMGHAMAQINPTGEFHIPTTTPCSGDATFSVEIVWETFIRDVRFSFPNSGSVSFSAMPTVETVNSRSAIVHLPWSTAMAGRSIQLRIDFECNSTFGYIDKDKTWTLNFQPLPVVQGSIVKPAEAFLRKDIAYPFSVSATSSNAVDTYRWYIDDVRQQATGSAVNVAFPSVGTHTVMCKPLNICGQEGTGVSTSVTVYCDPAGFHIDGPQFICPGTDGIYLEAMDDQTNGTGTYLWTRDGQTFSGNGVKRINVTQPGNYKVQATFPNGCAGELTQTVQTSSPPAFPITSVTGLKSNFSNQVTPLEVIGGDDATDFDWDVVGSTEDVFEDANGRVPKQKVRFTPNSAGNLTVRVTPLKNTCRGTSFEVPFESISEGWKNTDKLEMHHPDLNVAGGTVGYLYLPKHSPDYDGCFKQLGPVTLDISLDLGEYYNLGKNAFKSDVTVAVTAYSDISGPGETWTFPLHIDQSAPEQLFSKRITVEPGLIRFFKIVTSGYSTSTQAAANVVRMKATYREEDIVDVSNVSLTLAVPVQDAANRRWEQTFRWTSSCPDVPDYVFQLLKQDGTTPPEPGNPDTWSEATWKNALLIQTETSDPSVTLSMGEGSGIYYWRVTPLGNQLGGITNPENWGPKYYGTPLDYKHPEANKSWIYSRTFTEGNKVSEQVTYATGLNQIAQTVTRIQGENRIVAAQTLQDYVGRNAVSSLPIPVADVTSLQYVNMLLANGNDVHAKLYRARDFDSLDIPNPAYERGKYYSGTLVLDTQDKPVNSRVPSAEGYPFSQTLFTTDGTGRIREQAGVGRVHSKAGGKTIRTFYDTPSEGELVALFGSEAPYANSVQKITSYDANNVASVAYQTKDGKVIATALAHTGDSSIPLVPLSAPPATVLFEEVRNNQRVDNFTVVSRKPLFLAKTGVVDVHYEITPAQLRELCGSAGGVGSMPCTTCDYTVSFRFLKEGVPVTGMSLPSHVIHAGACVEPANAAYTTDFSLPLDGGVNYTLEKYLTLNNKTVDQPTKTHLDVVKETIESSYRSQLTARLTTVNNYIAQRKFEELNNYLSQPGVATYDAINDRYILPLLPTGTVGCQQFIYIPKATICPKEDIDNATCKMIVGNRPEDRVSFEEYFDRYYSNRPDITVPGNGTLEYLYFTNQALTGNKEQYFTAGKFDQMVTNLIAGNPQLAKTGETACQRVWRIWKTEVMAYEENLKYTVPTDMELSDLGNAVPAKFSLLQNFLRALDSDLQSDLEEGEDVCTTGANRPPFIIRDVLYGYFGPNRTTDATINDISISGGQAAALAPDLTYAYRLVYYDAAVLNMKQVFQFYANITTPPGDPRAPALTDFNVDMRHCDRYKMSQSTNLGDQNFSTVTDEDLKKLVDKNIQKLRNTCGKACEGRAEEFRQAIINELFEKNSNTVIEHYRVFKDVTYRKGIWVGVLDNTINTSGYTFSLCELENTVAALIENCKKNYCNRPLTPYDSVFAGRVHTVYGTPDERRKLIMPIACNFKIQDGQECEDEWDYVSSKSTSLGYTKKILSEGYASGNFRLDAEGNHYFMHSRPSISLALKESSGNLIYFSDKDNAADLIIIKYNPQGDLIWWRYIESRNRQQPQGRTASESNTQGQNLDITNFSVSLTGAVHFYYTLSSSSPTDIFFQNNIIHTAEELSGASVRTISGKIDQDGNLVWSHIEDAGSTLAKFHQEDDQGNVYLTDINGIVVKRDELGHFLWKSDYLKLQGSVTTGDPLTTVDIQGNVYVWISGSGPTGGGNLVLQLNGSPIEALSSNRAFVLFMLNSSGHYVWHHAYELNQIPRYNPNMLTVGSSSIFLRYSRDFVETLQNSNEFGIDYDVISYPKRLVYSEISTSKTFLSNSYINHSENINSGATQQFFYSKGRNLDYVALRRNNGYSIKSFDKTSKYATDWAEREMKFYVGDILVSNDEKLEFLLLNTFSPFTQDGAPLYGSSTLGSLNILLKDSLTESCSYPVCFQFTTPRLQGVKVPPGMDSLVYNPEIIPCEESSAAVLRNAIDLQVEQIVNERVASFTDQYFSTCSDPALINDKLTIKKTEGLYHFTLYYYDRAGNLVRTVPPEGVAPLRDVSNDGAIKTARLTPVQHRLVTEYQYNSLGQLIRQHTPDGNYLLIYDAQGATATRASGFEKPTLTDNTSLNASKYYNTLIYNDNGMLRFSRNAQQKVDGTYSYTKYDELGRVIEVGEARSYDETAVMAKRNEVGAASFPLDEIQFVTRTIYSQPFETASVDGWPSMYRQEENNLLNRVSFTYLDKDGKNGPADDCTYTIYDYDVHGNVRWLVQKMPGLAAVGIRYEYDLLTRSVKEVAFSPENSNASFYHRYEYDADKRLKKVQTSRDRRLWETEAAYSYYLHGPLKRMTVGEDLLQGVDYTYTIQGWLKGINHGMLDPNIDPGEDAVGTSKVGRDAFGMTLGYYVNDYVNSSEARFAEGQPGIFSPKAGESLFNGNITTWASNILYPSGSGVTDPQLTANKYTYDRLNRLVTSRYHTYDAVSKFASADRYKSKYTYDANGNILKAVTGSNTATDLDRITYKYEVLDNYKVNNRLNSASDSTGLVNGFADDLEPGQAEYNYQYDAIGNLTRDRQQQVAVTWNMYGKVEGVTRTQTGKDYVTNFMYDAAGNRVVKKRVNPTGLVVTDFYVRDAAGSIMGVYQRTEQAGQKPETLVIELPIYGSDRLGIYSRPLASHLEGLTETEDGELRIPMDGSKDQYEERSYLLNGDVELTILPGFEYQASAESTFRIRVGLGSAEQNPEPVGDGIYTRKLNSRLYQLSDHLGNVRVTTTDVKLSTVSGDVTTDYRPDVMAISNYYPFGMAMPGRTWDSGIKYRYGFNGKEKDNNGEWGLLNYDYGFRIYNPGLGRFLSVDPLMAGYPAWSPYPFAMNSPIIGVDLDGRELDVYWEATREFAFGFGKQVSDNYKIAERVVLHPIETTKSIVNFSYDKTKIYVTNNSVGQILQDYGEKVIKSPLEYSGPAIVYHQFMDGPVIPFFKGDFEKSGARYANHLTSAIPELIGLRGKAPAKAVGIIAKYKPCGCFTADTEILMADSTYKSIDKIKVGDKVLAYSDSTGYFEPKEVISVFSLNYSEILKIYAGDQVIEVTNEHPFLVGGEWVKAGEMKSGDRMTLYPKGELKIESIVHITGNFRVFNFTVADYHTYYVSTKNILVHNGSPCKFAKLLDFVPTEAGAQADSKVADNIKMIEWIREKNGGVDQDWPFAPLEAVEVDGKKVLLDGHHRYEAAKKAGYTGNIPYESVPVEKSGYTLEELRTYLPKEN